MRRHLDVFILLCIAVVLMACGRKEAPQVVGEGPPPAVASLEHEIVGNTLVLTLRLAGGAEGVGYQIDRSEIDPHCNCPGFWRRYYELSPGPKFAGRPLKRIIDLRGGKREFAFRIRAIDGLGRLGPWSKPIRAKSQIVVE